MPSRRITNSLADCSQTTANLSVPVWRTSCSTLGDRVFAVAGPRAWNSLPDAIRHNPSLAVFKRLLKTHLFTESFFNCPQINEYYYYYLFFVYDRASTAL